MARSDRFLRSSPEPGKRAAAICPTAAGVLTTCVLLCAASSTHAQEPTQQGEPGSPGEITELEAVKVTAQRPQTLYRSKPVERTAPTVFDRSWREPVNLQQIGMEGGVLPIMVRLVQEQAAKAARKTPGWKPPVQPATARPPPLDEAQLRRAAELHVMP